jgi:hypothetical protein
LSFDVQGESLENDMDMTGFAGTEVTFDDLQNLIKSLPTLAVILEVINFIFDNAKNNYNWMLIHIENHVNCCMPKILCLH